MPTPNTSSRRGVVFDVDGTLADTNYFHVVAWWHAFRAAGHEVASASIHRHVGVAADQLIETLLGSADERVKTAHTHFYAPYLEQLQRFPRADELLQAVAGLPLQVVLATSAQAEEVEALRRAIGADDVISSVTGSEDADESKPSPEPIQVALDKAGLAAADCVMVGDTVWDVQAAARAGLPCIAVLSGGIAEAELRQAGAVEVYRDAADLLERLEESAIGRLRTAPHDVR